MAIIFVVLLMGRNNNYKCFAFFVGFVVLLMCGDNNFEVVFLFSFGFVDV